jgi:hypothetical protein
MYDPMGVETTYLNATLQVNMSLRMVSTPGATFVPEPSSVFISLVGAVFVALWAFLCPRLRATATNAQ